MYIMYNVKYENLEGGISTPMIGPLRYCIILTCIVFATKLWVEGYVGSGGEGDIIILHVYSI